MPLVSAAEIIGSARAAGRGAGAFNVIGIEHAEAILTGAESAGAAVVLQISENCAAYHGGLAPVAAAVLAAARSAAVPAAVHLDHATSAELVREAVALGLGSVMYDASVLPYADNVAATAAIAAWCHDRGVFVEAELGEVGGKDGVHAAGRADRPGPGGGLRRGDRHRRAGGRSRQLARDAHQGRGARPGADPADSRDSRRAAGVARLVRACPMMP